MAANLKHLVVNKKTSGLAMNITDTTDEDLVDDRRYL